MPELTPYDAVRFWSKVDRREPDACWPWKAGRDKHGYGYMKIGNKHDKNQVMGKAHRISFEFNVRDPGRLHVCHKCDNPTCVNPAHLFLGTHLDNIRDRDQKARVRHGERHADARLTSAQVEAIRSDTRPQWEIAESFGICRSHVSRIKSRKVRRLA